MKCPKCQAENPDVGKFCRKCGTKLILPCPQCGFENLPDDMFCGECGHQLSKFKEAPPIDYSKPKSYTPKTLADKILTSRSSIEGERKLVTVFFADVANYTSMSEKLDPEEVHQIVDGCFKILMDEIHKYEGTITQFTGDAQFQFEAAIRIRPNYAEADVGLARVFAAQGRIEEAEFHLRQR